MANRKEERRVLEALLGAITPHANRGAAEPSAARLYVREHFETLSAARKRGITWPQIADVLAQAKVTADDGTPLAWRTVSSLFHSERYARGERRKHRKAAARPQTQAPTPQAAKQPRPAAEPAFVAEESRDDQDDHSSRGKFRAVPSRPRK